MRTAHATSADGLDWTWHGTVLRGPCRATWDARGARVTAVLADGRASYDGRATKEENFSERTGLARRRDRGRLAGRRPVADVRYLDVLAAPRRRPPPLLRGAARRTAATSCARSSSP